MFVVTYYPHNLCELMHIFRQLLMKQQQACSLHKRTLTHTVTLTAFAHSVVVRACVTIGVVAVVAAVTKVCKVKKHQQHTPTHHAHVHLIATRK